MIGLLSAQAAPNSDNTYPELIEFDDNNITKMSHLESSPLSLDSQSSPALSTSGVTLSIIAIIHFPSTQAAPISIKIHGRSMKYRLRRTTNFLHSCIFFRINSEIDSPPSISFS